MENVTDREKRRSRQLRRYEKTALVRALVSTLTDQQKEECLNIGLKNGVVIREMKTKLIQQLLTLWKENPQLVEVSRNGLHERVLQQLGWGFILAEIQRRRKQKQFYFVDEKES